MSTSEASLSLDTLNEVSRLEREHANLCRAAGYDAGCKCGNCNERRIIMAAAMPEVLRRLKAAEATIATMIPPAFGAPLQLGDRFQRRDAIYTVVDGADYQFNGYALLNLEASHTPFSSRTWSGWGWSLIGLAADIINDGTALKRLPRLPVAPST